MTKLGKIRNVDINVNLSTLNYHGLIAGATGSGKTTTAKRLIEILQQNDIPTLVTDIKGDISSLAIDDNNNDYLPVNFFDFYGVNGKQLHVSIKDMGVDAFSDLLELTDAQRSTMATALLFADDHGYTMNTFDDVLYVFNYLYDNIEEFARDYGYISKMTIGALVRKMNRIKHDKNNDIFNITNLHPTDVVNSNKINIIDATEIVKHPALYSSLMNYILRSFMDELPEVGNLDKPKAVIFIEEAHTLFNKNFVSNKVINDLITTIKLIRSKGIGVFFSSQSVTDIHNEIVAQCGFKAIHGLRPVVSKDFTSIRSLARSFNKESITTAELSDLFTTLPKGVAVIQQLDNKGTPKTLLSVNIDMPKCKDGVLPHDYFNNIDIQPEEEHSTFTYTYSTSSATNAFDAYTRPINNGYKGKKSMLQRIKEAFN